MQPHEVKAHIENGIPGSFVYVKEFSGGDDHYSVVVVAKEFEGLMLIKQHRLVLDLFQSHIQSGEVHALTMKTFTPQQWEVEKVNFGF